MNNQNHVAFFDTTLRDGEQSPGCSMTTQEKLTMAHALEDLGVDIIEAGFAMASEGDFAAIATITQASSQAAHRFPGPRQKPKTSRWRRARCSLPSASRIHVFLASSDLHLEYKLKMSRAAGAGPGGGVGAAGAVALWTMWSFRPRMRRGRIAIFWWRWCALPSRPARPRSICPTRWATRRRKSTAQMFREVRERIPAVDAKGIILSSHCHDDLGLAAANSLAAIQPARGRWSAPSTASASAPATRRSKRLRRRCTCAASFTALTTNIKLDQLYPTSEVLGQIITFKPSPNKAIVGANAFAHESGIHQHGMLANPLCYEIMTPRWWAWRRRTWCWASTPGARRCGIGWSSLAYTISREELQHMYYRFVALADRKKNIYDQDLVGFCRIRFASGSSEPVAELD